jgi:predicted NUDIX family phosphoesterase
MSSPRNEQVLVIPTPAFHRAGLFQGFCADVERYQPLLRDPALLRFLPRGQAEKDPAFKQIIPYVVFRCGSLVFHYQRGAKTTETRLRSLRSLGVGGHISAADAAGGDDWYRTGLMREITEEVDLQSNYQEHCLGLINDDDTPVGQVHLGVVHVFDLEQPRIVVKEMGLLQPGFSPLDEVMQLKDQFETWSQFLLAAEVLRPAS